MAQTKSPVAVTVGNAVLDVALEGQPFLVYNYAQQQGGLFKPYFYPIMGSNGWPVVQDGEFPGTLRGHYWHHGLFIGHRAVSHRTEAGVRTTNFWEEVSGECGGIIHTSFPQEVSGQIGGFEEQLSWRSFDGVEVLRETRRVVIPFLLRDHRVIDLALTYHSERGPIRFEKSPYNLLACRVVNCLCPLEIKKNYTEKYGNLVDFRPLLRGGVLVNSNGLTNGAVTGERAKWCDFSGPLDNALTGGIALLDHPANPRHPTYWNNWNNMTFMASFSHQDHFELPPGQALQLRYRVYLHSGNARESDVEAIWNDFAQR
jgi:hypothetical protein